MVIEDDSSARPSSRSDQRRALTFGDIHTQGAGMTQRERREERRSPSPDEPPSGLGLSQQQSAASPDTWLGPVHSQQEDASASSPRLANLWNHFEQVLTGSGMSKAGLSNAYGQAKVGLKDTFTTALQQAGMSKGRIVHAYAVARREPVPRRPAAAQPSAEAAPPPPPAATSDRPSRPDHIERVGSQTSSGTV